MKRSTEELQALVDAHNAPAQLQAELAAIRGAYTQEEIDTFPVQEAEARAYAADNTASTPLIDAIISESGETKADLITSILTKAGLLKIGAGKALGRKRKKEM
jgi:hypothetical protein